MSKHHLSKEEYIRMFYPVSSVSTPPNHTTLEQRIHRKKAHLERRYEQVPFYLPLRLLFDNPVSAEDDALLNRVLAMDKEVSLEYYLVYDDEAARGTRIKPNFYAPIGDLSKGVKTLEERRAGLYLH